MAQRLSPHDRFTRSLMSRPKVAEEFFKTNLPEHIKKVIDFSSLKLQKESFVDDNLKLQIADLLYAVKFNGQPGFLYLLLEHASKPDALLPFRILKYMVAIMDHHLKTSSSRKLPLVYPLILYTGKKPYTYSMDLFNLFPDQEKNLAKDVFTSPYHLIDLTQVSDEELKQYLWFGTMALTLKHIHDLDILPFVKDILESLKELEKYGEKSYIYTVIAYMTNVGETPRKDDFFEVLKKLESIEGKEFMTIADMLKPEVYNRGLNEGLKKGLEKGLEKGREEERIEIAKALLLKGIDIEIISSVTGCSKNEIKKLFS